MTDIFQPYRLRHDGKHRPHLSVTELTATQQLVPTVWVSHSMWHPGVITVYLVVPPHSLNQSINQSINQNFQVA